MRSANTVLFYAASTILLILLAVLCLFEVNSLWFFGHNGFNGSTNAHGARMMLQHDTWGLLKYYYSPGPPDPGDYYTRLPYLPNYFVAGLYGLTGQHDSEALARLVPIVFSVLSGVAAWVVLRRFWSRVAAVFGLFIIIVCPVFTVYAPMLDHEQGCFFYVIAYLGLYLSWLKVKDWRKFVGILVLATLSVQYDWTGYYIALPVALHAVGYGFWKAEKKLSWRPEYTFALVFSVVILLNVTAFFYAMGKLAGFDELRAGFDLRSQWPDRYLERLWDDVEMMYTYPVSWLGVVWLLRLVQRWLMGRGRLQDFIPLVFLWAQSFRSLFFAQAGHVHIFWVYYGVGFLAFAGADLIDDLVVRIPAALRKRTGVAPWVVRFQQTLVAGLIVAGVGWTAVDSYEIYMLGHKKGGSLRVGYRRGFNQRVREFQRIGQVRPQGLLLIHDSAWEWDPQMRWYLGYPHVKTHKDGRVPRSRRGEKTTSVVFDVTNAGIRRWLDLMSRHPVTIVDGRLAIIDLTVARRHVNALRSRELEPSLWYRYWTNFFMPPVEWVADPDTQARFHKLYAKHVDE